MLLVLFLVLFIISSLWARTGEVEGGKTGEGEDA
jgi:hypothetical protein